MWSIVSVWEECPSASSSPDFVNWLVRDQTIKIRSVQLVTSLIYRMSADRKSCMVIRPKAFLAESS